MADTVPFDLFAHKQQLDNALLMLCRKIADLWKECKPREKTLLMRN